MPTSAYLFSPSILVLEDSVSWSPKNGRSVWEYPPRVVACVFQTVIDMKVTSGDQFAARCRRRGPQFFFAPVMGKVTGAWLVIPVPSRSFNDDRNGPATLEPILTPEPPTTADFWGSEIPEVVTILD
uniref:Uncharacterized protein n=1 Tax=Sipha flava TaxID=143950 RepID=A0A2S2QGM2_9HEMI